MSDKRWFKEYGAATSWVLRLCDNWKGTYRTIHTDAAFASVKCLIATWNELKLFFNGMIKTGHTEFPLEYMYNWHEDIQKTSGNRGKYIILQSYYTANLPMHAVGWYDRTLKTIITNVGTSRPGTPSVRNRHRILFDTVRQCEITQQYQIAVPRPYFIELLYSCFSNVDIHDHLRQGSLALHIVWKTKSWWQRLFSTVLGIIIVDSYYFYKFQCEYKAVTGYKVKSFPEFVDNLAYKLIFNKFRVVTETENCNRQNSNSELIGKVKYIFIILLIIY